MDDLEKNVRECARHKHDCDERVRMLSQNNAPADPDEKRAASENLEVARADAMRAFYALIKAKSEYAR